MTNSQARMLSLSIALVGGAIAGLSDNLNVNVSIVIILITFILFLAEYVRSKRSD